MGLSGEQPNVLASACGRHFAGGDANKNKPSGDSGDEGTAEGAGEGKREEFNDSGGSTASFVDVGDIGHSSSKGATLTQNSILTKNGLSRWLISGRK